MKPKLIVDTSKKPQTWEQFIKSVKPYAIAFDGYGKTSMFYPFDIPKILARLNEVEGGTDKWGGSNTVGESPRVTGSKLN